MPDSFDYIVIGGGSAGATLAGRLSEDPAITVCVIEAEDGAPAPRSRFRQAA
jgi:choline dehydrogenase-like flavoprotein